MRESRTQLGKLGDITLQQSDNDSSKLIKLDWFYVDLGKEICVLYNRTAGSCATWKLGISSVCPGNEGIVWEGWGLSYNFPPPPLDTRV